MRSSFAVVALIATCHASAALSQTTAPSTYRYGLAFGVPISTPFESALFAGRATWYPSTRISFRGEASALLHVLDHAGDIVETPPCPSTCTPTPQSVRPASLAGLSGHILVNDDYVARGESGGYYLLGGGVYRGLRPSDVGSAGGAIEAGVGFKFNHGADAFEVKYVRIKHWIGGQTSFAPMTLSVAW